MANKPLPLPQPQPQPLTHPQPQSNKQIQTPNLRSTLASSSEPYTVHSISTLKNKNDPDLVELQFLTSATINTKKGDRVRISLANGQYFVLKVPEEYDDEFHEITSNSRYKLLAKFSHQQDDSISYEAALARANAIVLFYSLAHSLCRRDGGVWISASIDFYLCTGAMSVMYVLFLVARNKNGQHFHEAKLTLKTETLRKIPPHEEFFVGAGVMSANQPPQIDRGSHPPTKEKLVDEKMINLTNTPPVDSWIHKPLLVRCAPNLPTKIDGVTCTPSSQLRVNGIPIPFETKLFKGIAMIRIANLDGSPKDYFTKRNRKMQVAVQGQFKSRTRFDKVFSGQEFPLKIHSLPPKTIIDMVFSLLSSKLPPTFLCDVFAQEPYFLSPLVNTAHAFAVERPHQRQDIFGEEKTKWACHEQTELLGAEVPRNALKRRKFFAKQENLERFWYEPNLVYTFDYYQHYMDMAQMKLCVTSYLQFDVSKVVGKQPLQIAMAKNLDSKEYYWNFECWHQALVREMDDITKNHQT